MGAELREDQCVATPSQPVVSSTRSAVPVDLAHRRRGRPYRLPDDPTPVQSPVAGLSHRVAWLLGVSRVHASDSRLARREPFIEELRALGIAADTSRLSRWESGRAPVPSSVLGAYERILGLAHGQLVAAAAGMIRGAERVAARPEPLETDPAAAHQQLDELFEEAFSGAAAGHTWMKLCEVLTRERHLYLLPDSWAQVSELLADELGRASGLAYVSRFEALRMLIRNPASQRHAVKAVGALVTNPATEFVVHPLALLQEVEDQQATDLLLRFLDDGPGHLRAGSAWALAGQVARGHFAGPDLARLEYAAVDMLHRSRTPVHRLDALAIHAALPQESRERVASVRLDQESQLAVDLARDYAELVTPDVARSVSTRIAERVQDQTVSAHSVEPDLMLRRLIREAIFHVSHERRHQAALLIAVSPYRPRMADELLLLARGSDERTAVLAMTALFQIADERHRSALLDLGFEDLRLPVRVTATLTLGQVVGTLSDTEMRVVMHGLADEGAWGRAAFQVLGMAGAPCLTDPDLDSRHAEAATWWRRRAAIMEPMIRA